MKALVAILLVAVLLWGGCATVPRDGAEDFLADQSLAGHRKVVLVVHGLSCPLCSTNLDRQLLRIEGVEEVEIDLGSGEVRVMLAEDHAVAADALDRGVSAAGFTLRALRTGDAP